MTATLPDPAERSADEWFQVIAAKAAAGAPGALAACAEAIAAHPAERSAGSGNVAVKVR